MKKILVPTDFSECSDHALEVAASIAKTLNTGIILFHMIGVSQYIYTDDEQEKKAEASYFMKLVKNKFDALLAKEYMKGLEVESIVQNIKVISEINNLGHEKRIDLIVMGAHGTSGTRNMFVGSNAEKVVRTSDFPVLIIKNKIEDFKVNAVTLCCDLEPESVKAYRKATNFFKNYNSEIHTVYFNLPDLNFMSSEQMEKKAHDFLKLVYRDKAAYDEHVYFRNAFTLEEGIYSFHKKMGADLIVVLTHGRKGLMHFFSGSLGEDMASHAEIPIMTFKIL